MVKQDFHWNLVKPNLFETPTVFCQCPNVRITVDCLPYQQCILKNCSFTGPEESDTDLAHWWKLFEFFLPGRSRMVPFHGLLCFLSGSKGWTQVSSPVKILEKNVSLSVSKHTNNSKEMAFLSVLCSNIRLQRTHLYAHLRISISWMMWLTLPLLTEKLCAGCWVVMCQSSWTMASACCSISGLTAMTERLEWSNYSALLFLFRKPSLFFPSDQQYFCRLQHCYKHWKDVGGAFLTDDLTVTRNCITALFIMTITDQAVVRLCSSGAICQKYLWLHT